MLINNKFLLKIILDFLKQQKNYMNNNNNVFIISYDENTVRMLIFHQIHQRKLLKIEERQ